jgi:hypothetical protein
MLWYLAAFAAGFIARPYAYPAFNAVWTAVERRFF